MNYRPLGEEAAMLRRLEGLPILFGGRIVVRQMGGVNGVGTRQSAYKRFFVFEAKFGWSELVATLALVCAVPAAMRSPLDDLKERSPKLLVVQSEVKQSAIAACSSTYNVIIKNIGEYPVDGLQYVFDLFYLKTDALNLHDVHVYIDPPHPYESDLQNNYVHLRLRNPISSGKDVALTICGVPSGLTVLTDYGTSLHLSPSETIRP